MNYSLLDPQEIIGKLEPMPEVEVHGLDRRHFEQLKEQVEKLDAFGSHRSNLLAKIKDLISKEPTAVMLGLQPELIIT